MKIHLKDKGKIKKFQTCKYWSGDPQKVNVTGISSEQLNGSLYIDKK